MIQTDVLFFFIVIVVVRNNKHIWHTDKLGLTIQSSIIKDTSNS